MAEIIGQHGIAAFTNPSNGDALDATIVKGNDNSLRAVYVNHDSDPGIHVQSSLLASRPAAGTTGRKWLTTDSGSVKLWYDDGSMWQEISYVPSSGTASVGALTVAGDLTVDTTTLKVDSANNRVGVGTASPGATLDVTGTVRTSNTVTVTGGGVDITGNSTITGTLSGLTGVTVTGTVTATTFSGSGASLTSIPAANLTGATLASAVTASSLTSVGTLTGLTVSGAGTVNLQDAVLQRPRIQDYGEVRTTPSISANALTLNLANGNVFGVSLNANITTFTISNPSASGTACSFTLAFTADGTARSVTWPASVKWAGSAAPTLTSVNGKVDIFTFVTWDAGATWYGFVAGQNF
jgi:hypothetical protein